jgi:glycerol-3-phosphate O-acyltransferase
MLMVKNKEIDMVESVSKINYANGLKYFAGTGINDHQDTSRIAHFETRIYNYLILLNT